MKLSDFEKHVQETLSRQQVPVDTNKLIHLILDKNNKRRKIIPIWWVFLGLAGGLGAIVGLSGLVKETEAEAIEKKEVVIYSEEKTGKQSLLSDIVDKESTQMTHVSKTLLNTKTNFISQNRKNQENTIVEKNIVGQNSSVENSSKSVSDGNQLPSLSGARELYEAHFLRNNYLAPFALNFVFPKNRTVVCPSFSNKKKISLFVLPEFGVSFPIKTLVERIPDNSEVTSFRKENEKTLEGLHGALYVGMYLGKSPFYLKTGLSYSRLTEKLDLVYNYSRLDTTYGIISITKSQNGDTVTVIYGDIVTESTTMGQKIKHHYFHVLDIPLCVGYQYSLGQQWSLGLEAGLILNIGLRTEGQVLNTLHDFKPVEKSNYQKTLGLGYRAGLEVEYALTHNVAIGLNSRLTGYNKPFTSPHSNFKQNYLIPGVHLYGKYYFSN